MRSIQLQQEPEKSYQVSEAFKTLRANLQFCGPKYQVIGITSCLQSDGKTTVSYEIASAYAADGKRVLLVDADLRKSVMANRLAGVDKTPGVTEIISEKASFDEAVCQTQNENLHILFAGSVPPNPSELLGSEAFASLIGQARQRYDIVIVDTPPLGAVIDAALIAKACDGTVLVICANSISRHFARNVLEQLKKSECPVLGVVLNRVMIHNSRYYKGTYYRYGKYYKKYYRYGYGYGDYKHGYGYSHGYEYGMEEPQKKKKRFFGK